MCIVQRDLATLNYRKLFGKRHGRIVGIDKSWTLRCAHDVCIGQRATTKRGNSNRYKLINQMHGCIKLAHLAHTQTLLLRSPTHPPPHTHYTRNTHTHILTHIHTHTHAHSSRCISTACCQTRMHQTQSNERSSNGNRLGCLLQTGTHADRHANMHAFHTNKQTRRPGKRLKNRILKFDLTLTKSLLHFQLVYLQHASEDLNFYSSGLNFQF